MRHRIVPILVTVAGITLLGIVAGIAFGFNVTVLAFFVGAAVASILAMLALVYFQVFLARVVWPKGVMGVDDRGAKVEFRDFKEMPTRFRLTREEWKRVHKAARRRPLLRKMLALWIGVVMPFPVLGGLWLLGIDLPAVADWTLGFVWLVLGVVMFRLMRVAVLTWRNPGLVVIGRCPSCGYDLAKLTREDDGCVVCSECGSAWVVDESLHGDVSRDVGYASPEGTTH